MVGRRIGAQAGDRGNGCFQRDDRGAVDSKKVWSLIGPRVSAITSAGGQKGREAVASSQTSDRRPGAAVIGGTKKGGVRHGQKSLWRFQRNDSIRVDDAMKLLPGRREKKSII